MHLLPRQLLRLLLQALAALWSRLGIPCLWGALRRRISLSAAPGPGAAGPPVPLSVNYHFTRQCNYKCGFCFHTAKTSFVLPVQEAKRGLRLLKEAGMEKINFSGGEPFLHERGEFVGKLVQFCKQELKLPSVSIVTNGSMVKERWFKHYGEYLDILAVSCDSFNEEVNVLIGRGQGKKNHVENLEKLKMWCQKYSVAFKINSVINRFNVEEDMNEKIKALNPVRWKMRNSYLILDEYMRFLNCVNGRKEPSRSILDVGVKHAVQFSGFDEKMFFKRGGKYKWSKADMTLQW
ncbi:S-adenosylmethionine-dependent nucleotide dehydratase RSAD2 isoform 2-T2 [Liasis olivaceus]